MARFLGRYIGDLNLTNNFPCLGPDSACSDEEKAADRAAFWEEARKPTVRSMVGHHSCQGFECQKAACKPPRVWDLRRGGCVEAHPSPMPEPTAVDMPAPGSDAYPNAVERQPTILGLPRGLVLIGGAVAAFLLIRK
jgi:hypothetical protein